MNRQHREIIVTYSDPNPLTCRILICLTMVDLPDSPAPETHSERTTLKSVKHGCVSGLTQTQTLTQQ